MSHITGSKIVMVRAGDPFASFLAYTYAEAAELPSAELTG